MPSDDPPLSELYRLLKVHPGFRPPRLPGGGDPNLSWLGWLVQKGRLLRFGAEFAGGLSLLGFFHEREDRRQFNFYFRWRCRHVQPEWQVFLHFLDPQGAIRFQGDHSLSGVVPDPLGFLYLRRTVEAPPEIAPGRYRIRLGVWIPQERVHLKLLRYRGCVREVPGWCHNAVLLGVLEV